MFTRPSTDNFAKYWLFHPNQPKSGVPFAYKKTYYRIDGGNHKWVSYRSKLGIDKFLFCCICLCYRDGSGPFSKGFIEWKHVYTRINEHENSKTHRLKYVDAHVMKKQFSSVDSLLTYGHRSIRKKEIENRRQVLFRIIDIIKFINVDLVIEFKDNAVSIVSETIYNP
uniref:TTF-type domain-containing protein n=1 Tax=Schizaphis graminum TaxID=13262 RepID=A0A2S2N8V4_SCHGA